VVVEEVLMLPTARRLKQTEVVVPGHMARVAAMVLLIEEVEEEEEIVGVVKI
jgi:hypothetical protein